MNRKEIIELIKKSIFEITDISIDEMEEESSLMDDIELSSLEIMNVFAELETTFKIHFTQQDMRNINTIKDICECIMDKN